jgi:hypothetical protein
MSYCISSTFLTSPGDEGSPSTVLDILDPRYFPLFTHGRLFSQGYTVTHFSSFFLNMIPFILLLSELALILTYFSVMLSISRNPDLEELINRRPAYPKAPVSPTLTKKMCPFQSPPFQKICQMQYMCTV